MSTTPAARRFRPVPGSVTQGGQPELAVWSGDTVVKDEEGFLYFRGRRDEMIKSSGYRISPTEVEDLVLGSGLVTEVVALGAADADALENGALRRAGVGDGDFPWLGDAGIECAHEDGAGHVAAAHERELGGACLLCVAAWAYESGHGALPLFSVLPRRVSGPHS